MFEYIKVSNNGPISINPKYIVSIEPDGIYYTHISLLNGLSIIVKEKYEVVKKHIANYLPPQ